MNLKSVELVPEKSTVILRLDLDLPLSDGKIMDNSRLKNPSPPSLIYWENPVNWLLSAILADPNPGMTDILLNRFILSFSPFCPSPPKNPKTVYF